MNGKPTTQPDERPNGEATAAMVHPIVRRSYANDADPNAVEWLSSIPIPIDTIDGRSITDVKGNDLDGYTECHFSCGNRESRRTWSSRITLLIHWAAREKRGPIERPVHSIPRLSQHRKQFAKHGCRDFQIKNRDFVIRDAVPQ